MHAKIWIVRLRNNGTVFQVNLLAYGVSGLLLIFSEAAVVGTNQQGTHGHMLQQPQSEAPEPALSFTVHLALDSTEQASSCVPAMMKQEAYMHHACMHPRFSIRSCLLYILQRDACAALIYLGLHTFIVCAQ